MTDQDDKRTSREIIRKAKNFPTLQKLLLRIMNTPGELARAAPDGEEGDVERAPESTTKRAHRLIRARVAMCLEDDKHNTAFARALSTEPLWTEVLAEYARRQTELRHCGWMFEPLPLEVRKDANDRICKTLE